jgi:maltooligosyltrehalose trehalohydrolase
VLADLSRAVREAAAPRRVYLVAESEPQDIRLLQPREQDGCGFDGLWIDDAHHSARVAATGQAEAYLSDFRGTAAELVACARHNALSQGQWSRWQNKPRGTAMFDMAPERAVFFLQNHDQVANSLEGKRLHQLAHPAVARALTLWWLTLPQTPMLFMGQEFFASSPFFYFADHGGALAEAVRKGRREFLFQFPSYHHALTAEGQDLPHGEDAFRRSRLDLTERERHVGPLALHRTLLALRREDPVLSGAARRGFDGAALDDRAFVLRWFGKERHGDRLLCVNLGPRQSAAPLASPLLAPPPGQAWRPLLSSADSRFGGGGAVFPACPEDWTLPGCAAVLLTSERP